MGYLPVVLASGLLMLAVERMRPGRQFERVAGWHGRAIALTVTQAAVAIVATFAWDRWFAGLAPWRIGGHGLVPDALIGYLVLTFVYYWWHRARHEIPWLWQWLHQIHHSACSIEVLTSFYKHPAELLANGILTSTILYLALGLDAGKLEPRRTPGRCGRTLLPLEHPDAPLAGVFRPAPGKPLHPSSARFPSLQLLRSAALGHTLRNLRESARATHPVRFRPEGRAPDRRHARRQAGAGGPRAAPAPAFTAGGLNHALDERSGLDTVAGTASGIRRPHSLSAIDAARRRWLASGARRAGSLLPPIRRPARVARSAACGRRVVESPVRARRRRWASLRLASRDRARFAPATEAGLWCIALGLVATALGSAWYHVDPTRCDALSGIASPMPLVFAGDRSAPPSRSASARDASGRSSLAVLVALGIASVVYWKADG